MYNVKWGSPRVWWCGVVLMFLFSLVSHPLRFSKNHQPGLGDFMLGLVSTFVMGLVSNRSFIMLDDNPLAEVSDPVAIDWRPGPDVPLTDGQNGERAVPFLVELDEYEKDENE